jgi:hypothetical protein
MTMANCVGWLFDISIEHDNAVIWIKTTDKKVLKLTDPYHPSFYILPRNETDGSYLFQILSRQQDIVEKVSWEENKFTDLFDYDCTFELAVNSWKIRTQLEPKIGKGKYVLAEYEKIKRITMPLGDNHILYVTTEVEADHSSLIDSIRKLDLQ